MPKKKTKQIVGKRNTLIKAIPKPLYKTILNIKVEMEKKNGRKVTLLEAGVEVARRANK